MVLIAGDGAMQQTAAELGTLLGQGLAPVIIVLNNGGYRASRLPVLHLFPDGVSAARGQVVGASFAQAPDFVRLAEACGAYGTRTEGANGLPEALAQALNATREGKSAVIDVRVEQD